MKNLLSKFFLLHPCPEILVLRETDVAFFQISILKFLENFHFSHAYCFIFRRKQLAPRSRLVRQCDECDFSSSTINEFKTHMKFEHGHDQVFLCDICRYYSLSSFDYQLHLNSHQ
jgi:hypothetical protein